MGIVIDLHEDAQRDPRRLRCFRHAFKLHGMIRHHCDIHLPRQGTQPAQLRRCHGGIDQCDIAAAIGGKDFGLAKSHHGNTIHLATRRELLMGQGWTAMD